MLRAAHPRGRKSGADLEAFGSRYAQHCFRQVCFELVENRLAQSGRKATRNALDHASNRVAFIANLLYQRYHLFCGDRVRTANNVFLHVFHLHSGAINLRDDIVNLRDVGDDLEIRIER